MPPSPYLVLAYTTLLIGILLLLWELDRQDAEVQDLRGEVDALERKILREHVVDDTDFSDKSGEQ